MSTLIWRAEGIAVTLDGALHPMQLLIHGHATIDHLNGLCQYRTWSATLTPNGWNVNVARELGSPVIEIWHGATFNLALEVSRAINRTRQRPAATRTQ